MWKVWGNRSTTRYALDFVARRSVPCDQALQVARERRGFACNERNRSGIQNQQARDSTRAETGAGWVGNDEVRATRSCGAGS